MTVPTAEVISALYDAYWNYNAPSYYRELAQRIEKDGIAPEAQAEGVFTRMGLDEPQFPKLMENK